MNHAKQISKFQKKKIIEMAPPTAESYKELQMAYSHFNTRLFDGKLPECLLTFQRAKRTMGYFSKQRFVDKSGQKTDELALNPEYFAVVPVLEVLATLVHEQCHMWQYHHGTPSRGRYHNKQWADKMESIGLCPSHTGQPGGHKTGDQMMDYPVKGGRFENSAIDLLATHWKISWYDRYPAQGVILAQSLATHQVGAGNGQDDTFDGGQGELSENDSIIALASRVPVIEAAELKLKTSTRDKFQCPGCQAQAWGKPSLKLICGECNTGMLRA